MLDANLVNVSQEGYFKLSKAHELKTENEKALMLKVLYARVWAA